MSTPNVALLRQTLQYIEAHPETWEQGLWINECGTVACFCGHAVLLSGCKVVPETEMVDWDTLPTEVADRLRAEGWFASIRTVGKLLLGLDDDDAYSLFDGDNSLTALRFIVAELCSDDTERAVS